MKCFICKKEINTRESYMVYHETSTGKKYRKYCCNKEEYDKYINDKELRKKLIKQIDSILERPHTCNQVEKEIKILYENGYSYDEIFDVALEKEKSIKYYIDKNNIDNEWNQVRYIFGTIKKVLETVTK